MEIIDPNKIPDDVMKLKETTTRVEEEAMQLAVRIKDRESIDEAWAYIRQCKNEVDAVESGMAGAIKKASEALDAVRNLRDKATKPRLRAIMTLKSRIGTVEFQLQEIARRKQEIEFAEARRKAEEKAKQEAARLKKQGEPEMAKAALASAAAFIPPVVPVEESKQGQVLVDWGYRLRGNTLQERNLSLLKFIKFIAERPDLVQLVSINEKAMLVKAKEYQADCPYKDCGVEFYPIPRPRLLPNRRIA